MAAVSFIAKKLSVQASPDEIIRRHIIAHCAGLMAMLGGAHHHQISRAAFIKLFATKRIGIPLKKARIWLRQQCSSWYLQFHAISRALLDAQGFARYLTPNSRSISAGSGVRHLAQILVCSTSKAEMRRGRLDYSFTCNEPASSTHDRARARALLVAHLCNQSMR